MLNEAKVKRVKANILRRSDLSLASLEFICCFTCSWKFLKVEKILFPISKPKQPGLWLASRSSAGFIWTVKLFRSDSQTARNALHFAILCNILQYCTPHCILHELHNIFSYIVQKCNFSTRSMIVARWISWYALLWERTSIIVHPGERSRLYILNFRHYTLYSTLWRSWEVGTIVRTVSHGKNFSQKMSQNQAFGQLVSGLNMVCGAAFFKKV